MKDLQVTVVDPVTRVVSFETKPRFLSGIYKLIQIVVLSLLNSPNKDLLDMTKGGGLLEMLGSDCQDTSELYAEVIRKVRKTEQEIIEDQMGLNDSASEKLQELRVVKVVQGSNIDELYVQIRLISQTGQQTDIMV
jgi:hypothetical protein